MEDLTVSLRLEGDVTIETVAKSADALHRLLIALAGEIGPAVKIEWVPADLRIGSLDSTYQARPVGETTIAEAEQVVENYAQLGGQLERHEKLPNSRDVVEAVQRLLKHACASAEELVLGTAAGDAVVDLRAVQSVQHEASHKSVGSVTGRVQTLSNRSSLQFVLYQEGTGDAVRCYARDDQAEALRAIWGRRACVRGTLTRAHRARRIISVRGIEKLEPLPDQPERRFEEARGTIKWPSAHPSPEQFIRALRDDE